MNRNIPQGFVDMVRSYGSDYADTLLAALDEPATVSVRANTLKGVTPKAGVRLVPWCESGFYLPQKPLFVADPAWHQGLYYAQDASSMVYAEAVKRVYKRFFAGVAGLRYLDACAAPGGKAGCAVEVLPPDAFVVANELDRHRANILMENMAKQGAMNVAVASTDAARFGEVASAFDIIAVDAPCSGEGMMRKEPEAVSQWSLSLIDECAQRQRYILRNIWPALKPGGVLIYSTCTFNRCENEDAAAFIVSELGGEAVDLGLGDYKGVLPGYRFTPGFVEGEGLFIAAFRKTDSDSSASRKKKKRILTPSRPSEFMQSALAAPGLCEVSYGNALWALPEAHADFVDTLLGTTGLLRPGLCVATEKGRDLVPAHELALAAGLNPEVFPAIDLDYRSAIAYLRGEGLAEIPTGLPRGHVLAAYAGRPLGFIKNVGRRANNLYPDAMRLRLDPRYLPEQAPDSIVDYR